MARTPRPPGARRRAPTVGDLVVLGLLVAAVPLVRFASARGARGHLVVLAGARGPERHVDARQDSDFALDGPLGRTVVRVRDGAAWIESSPCPNQLCRRMGRIHGPGRALVCLPNRVLVRFAGEPVAVDAVTR